MLKSVTESTNQNSHSTRSFSSSTDDADEYASNAHNIDYSIYKNCQRSKLKIVFMHKNDLRKWRTSQYHHNRDLEYTNQTDDNQNISSYNQNNVTNTSSIYRSKLLLTINSISKFTLNQISPNLLLYFHIY